MAQETKHKSVFVNEHIKQKLQEKQATVELLSLSNQFFYQYSNMNLSVKDLEMWLEEFDQNYDDMLKYDEGKKIKGANITKFIKITFKNLLKDTLTEMRQTQQKKKMTPKGDDESNSPKETDGESEEIDAEKWYKKYISMKYVILIQKHVHCL